MAINDDFEAPSSPQDLLAPDSTAPIFLLFLSSTDPITKQPWCSDVRASLPLLNRIFSESSSPIINYVYVGSRAEYKEIPGSRYRSDWDIQNVPTLARYERLDGVVKEVGRLVEDDLLDEKRTRDLIR